jgi:hypothetical protein
MWDSAPHACANRYELRPDVCRPAAVELAGVAEGDPQLFD